MRPAASPSVVIPSAVSWSSRSRHRLSSSRQVQLFGSSEVDAEVLNSCTRPVPPLDGPHDASPRSYTLAQACFALFLFILLPSPNSVNVSAHSLPMSPLRSWVSSPLSHMRQTLATASQLADSLTIYPLGHSLLPFLFFFLFPLSFHLSSSSGLGFLKMHENSITTYKYMSPFHLHRIGPTGPTGSTISTDHTCTIHSSLPCASWGTYQEGTSSVREDAKTALIRSSLNMFQGLSTAPAAFNLIQPESTPVYQGHGRNSGSAVPRSRRRGPGESLQLAFILAAFSAPGLALSDKC
ncbi:hypothetical protein BD413DRAFT_64858 [Trametes elegans]|nr:hypothetical protein BD413DRAFT_64858 [Trametes elegans]